MRERERSDNTVPCGEGPRNGASESDEGRTRSTVRSAAREFCDGCGALREDCTLDAEGWMVCLDCRRRESLKDHDPTMCSHPRCRLPF